jgi:diadenosine tetraphosphate (Ap4A) HIT family hydrolase
MDCPFCDKRRISISQIAQTCHWRIIHNLKPMLPGHSLLTPKRHVERFDELNSDESAEIQGIISKANSIFARAFGATAFSLILQDGKAAGQSVPHLHLHITPRKDGDIDSGRLYSLILLESAKREPLSDAELKKAASDLRGFE